MFYILKVFIDSVISIQGKHSFRPVVPFPNGFKCFVGTYEWIVGQNITILMCMAYWHVFALIYSGKMNVSVLFLSVSYFNTSIVFDTNSTQ